MAHWAFYAVLAAMAVTGSLAWFGDVTQAAQAHNVLKMILLALIALHVLAVPFHRVVLKNNVMRRMIGLPINAEIMRAGRTGKPTIIQENSRNPFRGTLRVLWKYRKNQIRGSIIGSSGRSEEVLK